mgnify:CR=1 FL=1
MDQKKKEQVARIVGARIAYYRTILNMAQKDLATALHISASTLAKIEQGKYGNSMSLYHLLDLADIFGVSPSALFHTNEQDRELLHKLVNHTDDEA